MTSDESVNLVRQWLPHSSLKDAERLAAVLSAHPLSIKHASSFLANQLMSIDRFCADLEAELWHAVGRFGTDDNTPFSLVLRKIVDTVKQSDGLAYDLLMGLAAASSMAILPLYIVYIYAQVCNDYKPVPGARFNAAVALLEQYSFLDLVPFPGSELPIGVVMHTLTQRVLRYSVADDMAVSLTLRFVRLSLKISMRPEAQGQPKGYVRLGNSSAESRIANLITIDLLSTLIIHNYPPDFFSQVPLEDRKALDREGLEDLLALLIRMEEDTREIMGDEAPIIPQSWIDWAAAHTMPAIAEVEQD